MGRRKYPGARGLIEQTRGGVLALVALFLPIAVLCVGIVVDLGTVFFVRKAVQAACDLGALAGVQELDWDLLAVGHVAVRVDDVERIAVEVARENLESVELLVPELQITAKAENPPAREDPVVSVEAVYTVRTPFLRSVPGLGRGFQGRVTAEASVVKRTKW